ncbi:helix-turn-helix domain-containing protein, partial [Enterococcus hirae]
MFRAILFKRAWENITLTQLQEQLSISQVSIRNLIKEINEELESKVSIEIKNNEVFLKKNELVVEQIIHFYSINDNGYKILEVLFMKSKVY